MLRFLIILWAATLGSAMFWLVTVEDAEEAFPQLASCGFNYYGASAYLHFLHHSERMKSPQADTQLVLLPPYFTIEHNWPVYGGGNFDNNMARPGKDKPAENGVCRNSAAQLAEWALGRFPTAVVVVHDGSGDWLDGYDTEGAKLASTSRVLFAKGDALETRFRHGWDISMPPPMSESMGRVRSTRDL